MLDFYVKKVNNFFIKLGGENRSFKLKTKTVTFATLEPSKWNLHFIIFTKVKNYKVFKILFKILLIIPYFFTEKSLGRFIISCSSIWVGVGKEPISVFFCANFLVELVLFVLFLSYFLRLNTVYDYCIDTYGLSFVELYVANPLTAAQVKLVARTSIWIGVGFSLDQVDKFNCSNRAIDEANTLFNTYKTQGISLNKGEVKQIYEEAFTRNTSRIDQFSESISTMLGSLGRK